MTRADIVVVGAGAAGCVVASRLSERRDRSVLLLEAGEDQAHEWPGLSARRTASQTDARYVQGFGIGGSAAINAMVMTTGEPEDYDEWERVYGCTGWGWRDVQPWFRRVALPMRRPRRREIGALSGAVLASVKGAERARLNRDRGGHRASVNEIYLEEARRRDNLQVRPNALVNRVVLEGRRAVGVALADGEIVEAGMVVVCAGALHSPAVLLRSSVDRESIGRGLHDHPSLSISLTPRNPSAYSVGPSVSVIERASHASRHDVQVIPFEAGNGWSLMAAAMRVRSRGVVRIASSNAATEPIVEFNMLADERDLDVLGAAARYAMRIARKPKVSSIATMQEVATTYEALRGAVGDFFHAAGSCRMGAASDVRAVVDERCRVIGYDRLVVCDASVIPNLPRGNPCLPTVMIAERIAAMIDAELKAE